MFKRIKFDQQLPQQLKYIYGIDSLLKLNANDHPGSKRDYYNPAAMG